MVSTVKFREQLRRTTKESTLQAGPRSGNDFEHNERTPLLYSPAPTRESRTVGARPKWEDRYKLQARDRGQLHEFFLNVRRTPGVDSPKAWVRIPAKFWQDFKLTMLGEYVNALLVFVPLGAVSGALGWDATTVFVLNWCAIIPLVSLVSFATQERHFGRLVHIFFCNAAEAIISIVALQSQQFRLALSLILGSIVNNLLLVTGICFFVGGITNMRDSSGAGTEQTFSTAISRVSSFLMAGFSSFIIVTMVLDIVLRDSPSGQDSLIYYSHVLAVILLLIYLLYLLFSLRTHRNLFEPESWRFTDGDPSFEEPEDHEASGPRISLWASFVILIISIALMTLSTKYLVGSIDAVAETAGTTRLFLGFIVIPMACSTAKNTAAVDMANRNNMEEALHMATEPSLQFSLCLAPALVLFSGVVFGMPVTFKFDELETLALVLSVVLFQYCLRGGRSNYFQGAMLMGLYQILILGIYRWDRSQPPQPS